MVNDDDGQKLRDARDAERELRLAASMRPARKARNKARYNRKTKHPQKETPR